ncbi:unnamed protein product, partial [Symbiodinium sp. KB8]
MRLYPSVGCLPAESKCGNCCQVPALSGVSFVMKDVSVRGDASFALRKGKRILCYELSATLAWEGRDEFGCQLGVKGTAKINKPPMLANMADSDGLPGDDESDDAQAESCIGAIIANATDEVVRSSSSGAGPGAEIVSMASSSRATQQRVSVTIGKSMEPRPEITLALTASRRSEELRDYVKSQDFWRVPHFFRDLQADFAEEE